MTSFIQTLLPVGVLLSHIVFAALVLALIYKDTWGAGVWKFLERNALLLGLLVSLATLFGSLFYSAGLGFEPCVLCWWQRIMLFPQAALFVVALAYHDRGVFKYCATLAVIALLISFYQIYATQLGGTSLLDCTAAGGACSKLYVYSYGYITIPVMSLTASAYLLLLAFANKKHE